MKGSTTMDRCAASAGGGFEATGAGAVVVTSAARFARKYQAAAAINTTNAANPSASGASDERFFGSGGFASAGRLRLGGDADLQRIDPDRLGDVLELGQAEIGDREIEPALHLTIGVLGETDRAGLADALQSRGDVDAVAHQVAVALLDDVAEMNADAKFDAAVGRDTRVALNHRVLHFDRAAHGVDDAAKLDQAAVAGALDDAPVMGGDGGVDRARGIRVAIGPTTR